LNLAGPLRVLPGRLSVARTFGDPEAKIVALGGNPKCVIHNPEIKKFRIVKEHDFIILGCDGIFDKLENNESISCVWRAVHDNKFHPAVKNQAKDIHKICGMGVEYVMKNSLLRRSLDNVTVVVIGFSNFKHTVFGHESIKPSSNLRNSEQKNGLVQEIGNNSTVQIRKTLERTKSANLP
jgi:protein phosphatase PTC2/3